MTRQPHDQFAKSFLADLLEPLGQVEVSLEVSGESRWVDLYFQPDPLGDVTSLGLLGWDCKLVCVSGLKQTNYRGGHAQESRQQSRPTPR